MNFLLVAVGVFSAIAAYGFDPTGNLTSSRVGPGAPTHTWAPADAGNRLGLRTSPPLEIVYDPAGRLIEFDPTGVRRTTMIYSPQDELLSVTPNFGSPVTRRYDALGRVYEENTVRKVYDGDQILFDGEVRRRWGSLDEPWGTVESTLAVTHQSVNFLGHGQDDMGAFGELDGGASAAGFQGRPSVGDLNDFSSLRLWDHRARVYSPDLKRFLTEDPHGLWGMNQYAFGGNDPVNFRDPDGRTAVPLAIGRSLGWSQYGVGGLSVANNPPSEWQFTFGVSGLAGGNPLLLWPGFFVGGGANIGMTSSGQFFLQFQGTGASGMGVFAGVGLQAGAGYAPSLNPGINIQSSAVADANVGWGYSMGGSAQYSGGRDFSIQRGVGNPGLGFGAQASLGVTRTVTLTTPSFWRWFRRRF